MCIIGTALSWGMFGLGMLMLIAILFRRASRYRRRLAKENKSARLGTPAAPARQRPHREPLHDAPPDLLRWQVEMHETARDLKAEIDSKMVALEQLIRLANQHAERLEQLLEQSRKEGGRRKEEGGRRPGEA